MLDHFKKILALLLSPIFFMCYLGSDRRPWRRGYNIYKNRYLSKVLQDPVLINTFTQPKSLPPKYGYRLDARVVEIPWALAHLPEHAGRLLDAGSSLNYKNVLRDPRLSTWDTSIITLAPESLAFWNLGISYHYGDMRTLPFRDEWFDIVICISTIEHIGMDNSIYSKKVLREPSGPNEFFLAVKDLRRILKKDGALLITFPYGKYEDHGWFQQFDAPLADKLIKTFEPQSSEETIYQYTSTGWQLSDRASTSQEEFFDVRKSKYFDRQSHIDFPPDFPAGERAVMCLKLQK